MTPKELAEAHWKYIEEVLRLAGEKEDVIHKIGWHYCTAMVHGIKHGQEDKRI